MGILEDLHACIGFDWDDGNRDKNWDSHSVSDEEAEQVFFNTPLVARPDPAHSARESRCYALGQTDSGRKLFVIFTIRGELIRIVSAREMTRREQRLYKYKVWW